MLKSSQDNNEGKSAFQTIAIELSKQTKKKQNKRPKIGVGRCGFKCTRTVDFRLDSVFLKKP